MLEWMHDSFVVGKMETDFASKDLHDCLCFIESSQNMARDCHMAIVDDNDEYMGTVSLKNICDKVAEFAITVRKSAMGRGYSSYAMSEIINIGFTKYSLDTIYWCVDPDNARAVRFYDKNNYKRVNVNELKIVGYTKDQMNRYLWYCVTNKRA